MFSCLMTFFFTSLMRMKPSVFWCSGYLFLIRFVGNGLLFDFVSGRRRLFFYIYQSFRFFLEKNSVSTFFFLCKA